MNVHRSNIHKSNITIKINQYWKTTYESHAITQSQARESFSPRFPGKITIKLLNEPDCCVECVDRSLLQTAPSHPETPSQHISAALRLGPHRTLSRSPKIGVNQSCGTHQMPTCQCPAHSQTSLERLEQFEAAWMPAATAQASCRAPPVERGTSGGVRRLLAWCSSPIFHHMVQALEAPHCACRQKNYQ